MKTLLWCFLLINILMFAACGSTPTTNNEDHGISRRQKEPKAMYGMSMETSKPSNQRTNLGLHTVQHTKVSQKARTNGAAAGGATEVKNPHRGRNSASTNSIKFSSFFIPVTFLLGCFF
ncbi:hypothetical protein VNO77_42717 [Canavalia gladiata]|uniref:Uncharacterized protein n=1 Tax=Canavalia gladiata TaxID=3824 RepID=A0AAN9JV03_CANGL